MWKPDCLLLIANARLLGPPLWEGDRGLLLMSWAMARFFAKRTTRDSTGYCRTILDTW
jgi:hypothetical protein